MNPLILAGIIDAVLKIVDRHTQPKPGEGPLTNEQVRAELVAEINSGKGEIAAFFAEKGLPAPE